jgi:hypothetical protein
VRIIIVGRPTLEGSRFTSRQLWKLAANASLDALASHYRVSLEDGRRQLRIWAQALFRYLEVKSNLFRFDFFNRRFGFLCNPPANAAAIIPQLNQEK